MIKAITFDLDDTLWDVWPVVERAEQHLHKWLRLHYPRIPQRYSPLELRELCAEIAAARPEISHDRTRLRKDALQLVEGKLAFAVVKGRLKMTHIDEMAGHMTAEHSGKADA